VLRGDGLVYCGGGGGGHAVEGTSSGSLETPLSLWNRWKAMEIVAAQTHVHSLFGSFGERVIRDW
jgi:hypothetical protein